MGVIVVSLKQQLSLVNVILFKYILLRASIYISDLCERHLFTSPISGRWQQPEHIVFYMSAIIKIWRLYTWEKTKCQQYSITMSSGFCKFFRQFPNPQFVLIHFNYMARCAMPVMHVWCFRCITCVGDTCVIHMFYMCNTYVGYILLLHM